MRTLYLLLCCAALATFSCKKNKDEVSTYELTVKAVKASVGTTTFAQIKHSDEGGNVKTLYNQKDDFVKTFAIQSGYKIVFSAQGTVTNGSATNAPKVSYEVVKITGKDRETVCSGVRSAASGVGNTLTFNNAFEVLFDGISCQ